jgi:hypothetical protein
MQHKAAFITSNRIKLSLDHLRYIQPISVVLFYTYFIVSSTVWPVVVYF